MTKPIARLTLVTTSNDEWDVKARGGDHGHIDCSNRQQLDDTIAKTVATFVRWSSPKACPASPEASKRKTRVCQRVRTTLRWTFLDGSDLPGSVTLENNFRHDRFKAECAAVGSVAKALGFKK